MKHKQEEYWRPRFHAPPLRSHPDPPPMAHAKVDAKQLGFKINDVQTSKAGNAETFALSAPWEITENGRLPISYDAVVSAVSQPVTAQDVLSIVFVLEWGGE